MKKRIFSVFLAAVMFMSVAMVSTGTENPADTICDEFMEHDFIWVGDSELSESDFTVDSSVYYPSFSATGWRWPVINSTTISSAFGLRTLGGVTSIHTGIDIPGGGLIVVAAKSGTIERVRNNLPDVRNDNMGLGNYVFIRHDDGSLTVYGHLRSVPSGIRVGVKVLEGQQIGVSGTSGYSIGDHLHFEIWRSGNRVSSGSLSTIPSNLQNPHPRPNSTGANFRASDTRTNGVVYHYSSTVIPPPDTTPSSCPCGEVTVTTGSLVNGLSPGVVRTARPEKNNRNYVGHAFNSADNTVRQTQPNLAYHNGFGRNEYQRIGSQNVLHGLTGDRSGCVLPNATAYAWGRAFEFTNVKPTLPVQVAAGNWYNSNHGYTRGQTPRAGAIACWSDHVAFVERVDGNTITISESEPPTSSSPNGTYWRTYTSTNPSNPIRSGASRGSFLGYIYVAPRVTVTFNSNGGSAVTAQTVDFGTAVARPTNPTRTGHTFDGWFVNTGFTNLYDFTTPVITNITLFAKWIDGSSTLPPPPIETPVEPPVKTPVEPPVKTPIEPPVKTPVEPPIKTPPGGFIFGDVNADKKVDGADAVLLLRKIANDTLGASFNLPANFCLFAADVNDDGKIDGADAVLLLRYIANETLGASFPNTGKAGQPG
jgi:uncharacterized repeat protein (TIGR02543 family)